MDRTWLIPFVCPFHTRYGEPLNLLSDVQFNILYSLKQASIVMIVRYDLHVTSVTLQLDIL
jgi:hypothetical protein